MDAIIGYLAGLVTGFIACLVYSKNAHRQGYRDGLREAVKYRDADEIDYEAIWEKKDE